MLIQFVNEIGLLDPRLDWNFISLILSKMLYLDSFDEILIKLIYYSNWKSKQNIPTIGWMSLFFISQIFQGYIFDFLAMLSDYQLIILKFLVIKC